MTCNWSDIYPTLRRLTLIVINIILAKFLVAIHIHGASMPETLPLQDVYYVSFAPQFHVQFSMPPFPFHASVAPSQALWCKAPH